jgi:hypothetical protein
VWAYTQPSTYAYPGTNISLTDAIINDANYRPCSSASWSNGDDIMGCVWSGGGWQNSYGTGSGGANATALPALRGYVNGPSGVANGTPLFPFDLDGRAVSSGGYVGAEQP